MNWVSKPVMKKMPGPSMWMLSAVAAATATSIHMSGPGMFFITGPETKFIDIGLLDRLVHEMVKMSPLQGSRFEVLPASDELGILGAAVNAEHAKAEAEVRK